MTSRQSKDFWDHLQSILGDRQGNPLFLRERLDKLNSRNVIVLPAARTPTIYIVTAWMKSTKIDISLADSIPFQIYHPIIPYTHHRPNIHPADFTKIYPPGGGEAMPGNTGVSFAPLPVEKDLLLSASVTCRTCWKSPHYQLRKSGDSNHQTNQVISNQHFFSSTFDL